MSSYQLSADQLEKYHKDGYHLVKASEHRLIWADEVHSWPREHGKWMPYDEINEKGESQLMRTECFVDYHPGLKTLLCGDELGIILHQLADHDMLLFKDKINYKGPNGNGFQAHTDAPAYDHIGKIKHITANICVDESNQKNGHLEVVPGSHNMDIDFVDGGRIAPEWEERHEWVPVPLRPGDILFFGSHLAHRSGPNRTDTFRTMIYATYHSTADGTDLRDKYYEHRRVVFPPDHGKPSPKRNPDQDYEAGWKRYGFAAPFAPKTGAAGASRIERPAVKA
ncbi:hypothetical protein F5884DRAFT_842719 [Xylogone sp. PMI_703]|nr:hypothetical protein F5884DRAFT_842719 [Xylogone sp. PMI_703]